MTPGGRRIIYSTSALEATEERLFPARKHRSARIRKKANQALRRRVPHTAVHVQDANINHCASVVSRQNRKVVCMNQEEHLLTCLAEECAEVAQRVSKSLRFGLDEIQRGQDMTNADRIIEEMHDLIAVYGILNEDGVFAGNTSSAWSTLPDEETADAKHAKIERYMEISRREGVLA